MDGDDGVALALLPAAVDDSCARRSGLPRWTESKSSSAELLPMLMLDAAPPPMPMRKPGPPSWISSAPGGITSLCVRPASMLPRPPAIMMGL